MVFNTAKNTIIADVFHLNRTPLDFDNVFLANNPGVIGGAGQTNSKQYGTNITWSHRITARTSLSTTFRYTHRYFPTLFRKDDIYMGRVVLARRLSDKMFGFLSYRYRERHSDDAAAENAENRVMASLSVRF